MHTLPVTLPPTARAQAPGGGVRVAAAAGSALQPQAVVLLEAASVAALAASKPGDWLEIEPSASFKVGRWPPERRFSHLARPAGCLP